MRPIAAPVALRDNHPPLWDALFSHDSFWIALQPVVDLSTGEIVGAEALARFEQEPYESPDKWFARAAEVGMDRHLELASLIRAMDRMEDLPENAFLSVNIEAATLACDELLALVSAVHPERIVLEITEHSEILDHYMTRECIAKLRQRRVRVAVDDVGMAQTDLMRIFEVVPDVIKLDMSLVQDIDRHPGKRARVMALLGLAQELGAMTVAEGIETEAELAALQGLGVRYGQGFLLSRPTAGRIPRRIHSRISR